MARYIIEEMPDLQKTGKRITYPKFARIDNTSIKELAQRVGDVSGFSAGDIEGVLLQTAIEMAHLMAEGRSVQRSQYYQEHRADRDRAVLWSIAGSDEFAPGVLRDS